MEQTLRVELQYKNMRKPILHGYFYDGDIEAIERSMKGKLEDHPLVLIYTRRGKKPIYSFMGW